MKNLNRLSHDILLLQIDIEDQIILGEKIHNEHGEITSQVHKEENIIK